VSAGKRAPAAGAPPTAAVAAVAAAAAAAAEAAPLAGAEKSTSTGTMSPHVVPADADRLVAQGMVWMGWTKPAASYQDCSVSPRPTSRQPHRCSTHREEWSSCRPPPRRTVQSGRALQAGRQDGVCMSGPPHCERRMQSSGCPPASRTFSVPDTQLLQFHRPDCRYRVDRAHYSAAPVARHEHSPIA